ncbi:phosphate ABC transporter permease subunit PstC [bacterium]|jgi:phosphate transport system permease protein|nr:phosphate ABC transporter permease subunit PstC [bacterium]MBR4820585.1 phosphate ABC transporter permease subunit PstC [bacterium]
MLGDSSLKYRVREDCITGWLLKVPVLIAVGMLVLFFVVLTAKSWPLLTGGHFWQVLTSSEWLPSEGKFGLWPFIIGTIAVTFLTMVLAVPVSVLAAVFLNEFAPQKLKDMALPVIDVLAAVPSVIYGACGVIAFIPMVKALGGALGINTTGRCLLTAALVLAIMVIPVILSIVRDVLAAIPQEAREASLALGSTRWETTYKVVLKLALPGIIAAIMLGVSRAFGETMAVMMVAGSIPEPKPSLFKAVYTLPALIADKYGEMLSIKMYDVALMTAALILMVVIAVVNFGAHLILIRLRRRY